MDDFFRVIRSFLGLPKFDDNRQIYPESDDNRNSGNFGDTRYDAFLDPMEMHRYFEQQMNKILGEFDIFEFGQNDSFFGGHGEIEFFDRNHQLPPSENEEGTDLRNQFLKPGFERPTQKHLMDKRDKELKENEININDLDSIVSGNYFKDKQEHPKVTTRFFGKSISTKTITKADGSIEIHKTIRDNEGNEETTITKRIGDKEHTLIKKKDSTGKEEIIENFVNIDDTETLLNLPENKPWSFYDRFFK
ncbi:uncharacterized protein LOC123677535 isoform X2 [Harmonia axyridis]|uniref:uncharacterized protein LOC123677535 isoform X2 n=1 Tax=Harmonia axyridis TaxID=115357 RepID=UPI001E277F1D|nr:uncharacterized protein LOC123677535 isoform X2 [Harmonia axyridis]